MTELPVRTNPEDAPGGMRTDEAESACSAPNTVDRRHAIKIMALAAATPGLASCTVDGGNGSEGGGDPVTDGGDVVADTPNPASNPKARGDAWDPDLIDPVIPWDLELEDDELASLAVLCDLILPADERSPSASSLGAHDFINEWVSAPYEGNGDDLVLVRGGLRWLDRESTRRFGDPSRPGSGPRFRDLPIDRRTAICDDICYAETAPPGFEFAARFFDRVRFLASTAFWTTPEGMDDLQYVGNVPIPTWDPPPDEVLRHIGLLP